MTNLKQMRSPVKTRKGFSLVELSVVVIIIGVLAAFGIPRMLQNVERSKASEAFKYLASVRASQERYQAREGTYAAVLTDLDIEQTAPVYFTAGAIAPAGLGALEDTWTMTLTRAGAAAGYGAYTVIYSHDGYDTSSTIHVLKINPLSTGAAPPPPPAP